ncbi:MAG: pyridoxal-phosphate dependent enzyme [Alphaproteobacteria bacterium]|nr:pyridoxal-phosphate dependent enzyme [Alphaproteobacteria bacterium]MCB9691531.1 pyridoxal-phosphate dependent enzyme [Alphaproteobacteria bacterium]
MPLQIPTPLVRSTPLSAHRGTDVWLKLESAQPAGSFKQRGMGAMVEEAVAAGAERVVTSSGGNAGLAVAVCCREVGIPCVVVVPRRTGELMKARIAAEGADVRVHGEVWDDAHEHATELAADGGFLVHPFDHPAVWRGNATLVHEVAEAMPSPPGSVVVSVGGGGLLAGVLQGLRDVGWADVPVVAVETHGTASLAAALAAGRLVTLPDITSIALTLGAKTVAEEARVRSVEHGVRAVQVSDRAAVDALERFLFDHRVLVEPACGAALAVAYGDDELPGPVLVVVCGGAAATPEALEGWRTAVR